MMSSAHSRSSELQLADCTTSRPTCAKPNVIWRSQSVNGRHRNKNVPKSAATYCL